jgi:hypothetical protein
MMCHKAWTESEDIVVNNLVFVLPSSSRNWINYIYLGTAL